METSKLKTDQPPICTNSPRNSSFLISQLLSQFASAVPSTIESEDGNDEDDCQIIEVEKLVLLQGGVTDKHLEATIKLWCGMLMHAQELFEGPTVEATDGDED